MSRRSPIPIYVDEDCHTLTDIPRCEEKLAAYTQDGNSDILRALDEKLDRAAAGVL